MSVISKRKHHWAADSDLTSRVTVIAKRRERANWNAAPVRGHIDQNGFGRKMLEKFGWSPGEGLGAQKQGIKEHLRARKKSDNAGIGFKDSGEEWLKHQNDFSELLANLSGENTEVEENDVSISAGKASLELKSKQSRARVHCSAFTDKKDCNNGSAEDLLLTPDSSDSGTLGENSEITMRQKNYGTEKTENAEKESKVTSGNDLCTYDRTQYSGKKKKKHTRSEEETDVFRFKSDHLDDTSNSENNKMIQQDLCKHYSEDSFLISNDADLLLGQKCSVKFIKTVNPFLIKQKRKTTNQSDTNAVDGNHTVSESSGNTNQLVQTQNLEGRKCQSPSVSEKGKQLGVLIKSSRYQACIIGECPKVNNINELYYKYVMRFHSKTNESKDLDSSTTVGSTDITEIHSRTELEDLDVIYNNSATVSNEDTSTVVMRTQNTCDSIGKLNKQQCIRIQHKTCKTKKARNLILSRKSRVITKTRVNNSKLINGVNKWSDPWRLHTVQGVNRYMKSLNKVHIERMAFNFKGANLINIDGYPTQIGDGSISISEKNTKSEETCVSEKQSEEVTPLSGDHRNKYVASTSRKTMNDGERIIINNTLSNRQPAVWL